MGDNDVALAYAKRLGNVPARLDAAAHPKFAELGAMTADHALLTQARALRSTVGANAMMAGVARATEAVLIGKADGNAAQQLLVQYVSHVLGDDTVGMNRPLQQQSAAEQVLAQQRERHDDSADPELRQGPASKGQEAQ